MYKYSVSIVYKYKMIKSAEYAKEANTSRNSLDILKTCNINDFRNVTIQVMELPCSLNQLSVTIILKKDNFVI